MAQEKLKIVLKDFEGKAVLELNSEVPLPHPYMVYQGRLFVSSRDDLNTYLERSFCVFFNQNTPPSRSQKLSPFGAAPHQ